MKRRHLFALSLIACVLCAIAFLLTDTNLAAFYLCFSVGVLFACVTLDVEVLRV